MTTNRRRERELRDRAADFMLRDRAIEDYNDPRCVSAFKQQKSRADYRAA